MPRNALIYARLLIVAAVVTATLAALASSAFDPVGLLICTALAALTSTFKFQLPGVTSTISPSFVFLLVAASQLNCFETMLVGALSTLGQALWRPKVKPTLLQIAFNASAVALSGAVAFGVAHEMAAGRGFPPVVMLGIAGIVLFVANTLAVSTILCLLQGKAWYTVFHAIQTNAMAYYLGGGVLAALWSQVPLTAGFSFSVLAAGSTYLLAAGYRGLMGLRMSPHSQA